MQIDDSDGEEEEDSGMDREKIANQLFEGDDVSFIFKRIYLAIITQRDNIFAPNFCCLFCTGDTSIF